MKSFDRVVIVHPQDPTINFLNPIVETILGLYPQAKLLSPPPGKIGNDIDDDTQFIVFLGHGSHKQLYGSVDENGNRSTFMDIQYGKHYLDNISCIIFACNSNSYIANLKPEAYLPNFISFGDMPTDWDHINDKRRTKPDLLTHLDNEALDYYKSSIVKALSSGLKAGYQSSSFIALYNRILFTVLKNINEIILTKQWSSNKKHNVIYLLKTFIEDIRYTQKL